MNGRTKNKERLCELLLKHIDTYPNLQVVDVFKYLFHSTFGCEHLVTSEEKALEKINKEYKGVKKTARPFVERLDGGYSRVHFSCLDEGLKEETLARLFCLSSKKELNGREMLEEKLSTVSRLVLEGALPFDTETFRRELCDWRDRGYPAVHHSDGFKAEYKPAYRVVANKYADFAELFLKIDRLGDKRLVVAIEGGSASGKTTLASILNEVYGASVIHMDDFFLRPEQRTRERLSEVGGNIDRERFIGEVLTPLKKGEVVRYRPFDCGKGTLGDIVTVTPKRITVVEGVYSMHPEFGRYYGLSVFLDIDKERQKDRILKRNSEKLAKRFFDEWIPLEDSYYTACEVKKLSDIVISVGEF